MWANMRKGRNKPIAIYSTQTVSAQSLRTRWHRHQLSHTAKKTNDKKKYRQNTPVHLGSKGFEMFCRIKFDVIVRR